MNNTNNTNNILSDFTPRERQALERATAKLRAKQPIKEKLHKPNLRGCYYNVAQGKYVINVYIRGQRVYVGTMREWNEKQALQMQHDAEQRLKKILKK